MTLGNWIYYSENMLGGQIEAYALFWFVTGTNHRGLFIPTIFWQSDSVRKIVRAKLLPIFRIGLMTATPEYSKRWILQLVVLGFFFGISLVDGVPEIRLQRGFYNVW